MRRLIPILVVVAVAAAQDAETELAKLEKETAASKLGYLEAYKAFKPRYEALAESHPGTDEALSARLWLLRGTWWLRIEDRSEKGAEAMAAASGALADAILAEYPDSPRLAEIPKLYYVFSADQRERYFTHLLEKSPHEEVRAAALLPLAVMRGRSNAEEGRRLLEQLKDAYGALPYRATTYGAIAQAHLTVHDPDDLQVGKAAPEIEGTDHEGKPMRLSAFRGKVVLLDFWGDW